MKRGPQRQSQKDQRGGSTVIGGTPKSAIPVGKGTRTDQLARGKGKPSDLGSTALK